VPRGQHFFNWVMPNVLIIHAVKQTNQISEKGA